MKTQTDSIGGILEAALDGATMTNYTPAERAAMAVSTRIYQAERDVPPKPIQPGELARLIEAEYAPVISGLEALNRHTLTTKTAENKRLLEALEDIEQLLDCGNIEQSHWDDCLDVARAALGKKPITSQTL